jgi:O-antigen/teichoic acid export membrane protein
MNQVSSNARWLAISQIVRLGVQLLSVTILARILKPEYYGIVALSSSVMAFISLFKDLGIGASLIQTKTLTDEHKNTAFVISFGMSLFLLGLIAITAPFIADYYHEPDLKWILILVAIGFPISSVGIVPACIMEREGRFKELAIIEAVTNFITFAITLTFALTGFGVYSLVIPSLVVAPLYLAWVLKLNDWRPSFKASYQSVSAMFGFSANLTGFNLINFFSRNLDVFIVGKLLGTTALGLYSTSMKLMLMPLQTITYVSNRALFPVLSQLQHDQEAFKNTYFSALSYVSLITFPMMFGLWASREAFVNAIYGTKWLGLIDLLYWLCLTGALQSINSTTGTVFMAKGKTHTLFRLGFYSAVLQVAAFYLGSLYDIKVMCKYYFIANILIVIPHFYLVIRLANSSFKELMGRLQPAIVATSVMLLAATLVNVYSIQQHSFIITLMLQVFLGGTAYLIVIKVMFPASWGTLLGSLKIKMPRIQKT